MIPLAAIGSFMGGVSGVLGALRPGQAPAAPSNSRADGYSLGGMAEGSNTGGATGGAYGGAWSQANVDGSNWVVNLGGGTATGGGKSGGNGGVSPTQTGSTGSVAPPFSLGAGLDSNAIGGMLPLIALAVVAYMVIKR